MKKQRWNYGFTLVEWICAMAVTAIMAAAAVPFCAGWILAAEELRIREEARGIRDSLQLYILAYDGQDELDGMMLLEQVSDVPAASSANPLRPYLLFEPSRDLVIESITLNQQRSEVQELILVSKNYRVTVSSEEIDVKHR